MATRPATPDDAAAIARVHVAAWQAAYRGGLMPDAYLDALDVDERARFWRETLAHTARSSVTRLVAVEDGNVVGFAVAGPEQDDVTPPRGELVVCNVHPEAWGRGHGTALLAACCEHLRAAGFDEAVLWVHPDNARARRFYEREGWSPTGRDRSADVLDVSVPETQYARSLRQPPAT